MTIPQFPYLEKFLDNVETPIILQDTHHKLLWANKPAVEIAGRPLEELIGKPCHEVIFGRKSRCKGCPIEKSLRTSTHERSTVFSKEGKVWKVDGYPITDKEGNIVAVVEKAEDITAKYVAERNFERIRQLSRSLVLEKDEKAIAEAIAEGLRKILDAPAVNIWIVEGNRLVCKAYRTDDPNNIPPESFPLNSPKGVVVEAVRRKAPIYLSDTSKEEKYIGYHKSEICTPIIYGEKVLGIINVESNEKDAFDKHYLTYLQVLSNQAALAIENARMFKSIKASEEFHRAVLETIEDAIVALDAELKVVFWNKGAERISGYRKEEVLGRSIYEFMDSLGGKDKLDEVLARALEKGYARCKESEIKRKDGTHAIISQTLTFLGKNDGFVITARDITAIKRAERELEKSEMKYRLIFEESPLGLFQSAPDGRLLSVNKTLAKMLGFKTADELLSHFAQELYLDVSDRKEWQERLLRDKSIEGFEVRLRRTDGSTFWARLNVVGVVDRTGDLYYEGSVEDITEKKIAEHALAESESRYRNLVEHLPVPLIVHKGDKILYANLAALNLLEIPKQEDATSLSLIDFVHPSSAAVVKEIVTGKHPSLLQHEGTRMRLKMRSRHGRDIEAETTWMPATFHGEETLLMVINDITYEVLAMERLKASEKKYRSLVENLPAIVYLDSAYDLWSTLYISPRIKEVLGFTPEEYISNPDLWLNQIYAEDKQRVFEEISEAYDNLQNFSVEYRMIGKDGKILWIRDDAVLIRDENGKTLFYQGIMFDISEQKANEERLAYMANHDMLTGLPNRMLFMKELSTKLKDARDKGMLVAVMLLDIDQFKRVNDTLGHDVGDKLLRSVGIRLNRVLEGVGFLARMAGDEFIALVPNLSRSEEALSVARRMVRAFESPVQFNSHISNISISLGIAIFPEDDLNATGLLRKADMAMYAVKRNGGNGYMRYGQELEEFLDKSLLIGDLAADPTISTEAEITPVEKEIAAAG